MTAARDVLRRALCSQTRSCEKAGFGSALCGVCSSRAEDLLAALDAAGFTPPLPREATERMKVAGGLALERALFEDDAPLIFDAVPAIWDALIAAATEPPA